MGEYKIVNNLDGNEEHPVGELNKQDAYVEALRILGWSLVKVKVKIDCDFGPDCNFYSGKNDKFNDKCIECERSNVESYYKTDHYEDEDYG